MARVKKVVMLVTITDPTDLLECVHHSNSYTLHDRIKIATLHIGVARGAKGAVPPKISNMSCRLVLREAVSHTRYYCLFEVKNIWPFPKFWDGYATLTLQLLNHYLKFLNRNYGSRISSAARMRPMRPWPPEANLLRSLLVLCINFQLSERRQ